MIKKWFKKKFREWSKESWESETERAELGKVVSASSLYETRLDTTIARAIIILVKCM